MKTIALTALRLSKDAATPIYRQLEEALRRWAEAVPEGTRVPPERDLAEHLGVARGTVKSAMKQLLEAGVIVRRGAQGTFVAPGAQSRPEAPKAAEETLSVRQLLAYAERQNPVPPLRLLLFETYPVQRRFWEQLAADFNAAGFGLSLELDWLDEEPSPEELERHLAMRPADLIQVSANYRDLNHLLQPLPPDIRHDLLDPAYCRVECFTGDAREQLQYLLPVYFNYYVCFYDRARIRELDATPVIHNPYALLTAICQRLDAPEYLLENPADIILAAGFPETFDPDCLYMHLQQLEEMATKRIFWPRPQLGLLPRLRKFIQRERPLYICWGNQALNRVADMNFEVGMCPVVPAPGHRVDSAASSIGVAATSNRFSEINRFLHFVLTDRVQDRIAPELNAIGYSRTGALGPHAAVLEPLLAGIRVGEYRRLAEFIARDNDDIFEDLLSGRIDAERALFKIRLRYQAFHERNHPCRKVAILE